MRKESKDSWKEWLQEALQTAGAGKAHRICKEKAEAPTTTPEEKLGTLEEQRDMWMEIWQGDLDSRPELVEN